MATLIEHEERKFYFVMRLGQAEKLTSPREIFRQFPAGRCSFRRPGARLGICLSYPGQNISCNCTGLETGDFGEDISHL